MKAGILTFYDVDNYGAVLQAYALQRTLRKYSCESELISFDCNGPNITESTAASESPVLKRVKDAAEQRHRLFQNFREKYLTVSNSCQIEGLDKRYDFFICGSDQVWNPEVPKFSLNYFLPFTNSEKKYSYAASFGSDTIPPNITDKLGEYLSDFRRISVREDSAREIVSKLSGKEASVHPDPIVLLKKDERAALMAKDEQATLMTKDEEDFIFIYLIVPDNNMERRAREYASSNNKKLIAVTGYPFSSFGFDAYSSCSVSKWLYYVSHADAVFTNSFHGAAFALMFGRRLFLYRLSGDLEKRNARFSGLMQLFGSEYTGPDEAIVPGEGKLKERRREALEYLGQIVKEHTKNCYGCAACVRVCRAGAIKMKPNEEGFMYPIIDENKCTGCGQCVAICPAESEQKREGYKCYALRCNDEELLKNSTSGGAFSLIANAVLSMGGEVCGAAFDEKFDIRHCISADVSAMRGSKYVQSDIQEVLTEIKNKLSTGQTILFTGTPCQCHAVQLYTGNPDNLYTAAVICRGVLSPGLWNAYKALIEKSGKLQSFSFRSKEYLDDAHHVSYSINNNKVSIPFSFNPLMRLYSRGVILRDSCYNCPYTRPDAAFDFSLGDFHGIGAAIPELDDGKGTSFILVRGQKAEQLVKSFENDCYLKEVSLADCPQKALVSPVSVPQSRFDYLDICANAKGSLNYIDIYANAKDSLIPIREIFRLI